jgi:iron complex outermembrane receptor protein
MKTRVNRLQAGGFPRWAAWILTASLLAAATSAFAANTNAPARAAKIDLADLSLEELAAVKVQTVFGASRYEQKVTEAPAAISIVTKDDIKKFGHRTLADILNSVRGFYVTYDRGYSFIGVRGFNRLGDYGGRLLLMADGHRLNDGIFDQAAAGTDFPLDVDLIERVEVIRGPAASLYGNNALFDVINVVTRRGRDFNGAELSSSYGSYDTWTGRASYGQRFTNGVEFVMSGTLYDSAGQDRLGYPEFVAENLDGGWARNAFASLSYQDFTLQGGFSRRRKDWPTAAYDTVPNSHDPRLFSVDERAWADLKFEHEFDDELRGMARAYFDRYQYDADYPYDYDNNPATTPTTNRDLAVATSAGLEASASKPLWDSHRVTLGGEWRHDFELLQRNWDVDPFTEYLNSNEGADIVGLYFQDEWNIRKDLILNTGLRYDHYSTFGDTLNPRAALIYNPWQPSTFKFIYGQAFRPPNAYELYYVGAGSRANPSLQPETIQSYELIWEQQFSPRCRTSVSAFWNDVKNLINQELDSGSGLYYFNNAGSATTRGVGFEVEGKLSCGLRTLASYTFADTEDKSTGQQLENAPQHLGKLGLTQPVWQEKVFASLEMQTMSSRRTVAGGEVDPFTVVNFTLFSRELVKGLELSASIYNLFDQRYSHPVSADFSYTGPISGNPISLDAVQQDGRSFRVKLTYRF